MAAVIACESPSAPLPGPPSVRAFVVEEAALALDQGGRFRLPDERSEDPPGTIDRERAAQLGRAYVQTAATAGTLPIGTAVAAWLVERFQRPIDWDHLRSDQRKAYFALSAYELFPDSVPEFVRRSFGSHYLVPFYLGHDQAVSIAVSARAADVGIDSTGRLVRATQSGGEFVPLSLPWFLDELMPMWPEVAVELVFRTTGAKTKELPLLLQPGLRSVPHYGAWRLVLDRTVWVTRSSDLMTVQVDTVYVAPGRAPNDGMDGAFRAQMYIAASQQPGVDTIRWEAPHVGSGTRTYVAQLLPNIPVRLEHVLGSPLTHRRQGAVGEGPLRVHVRRITRGRPLRRLRRLTRRSRRGAQV